MTTRLFVRIGILNIAVLVLSASTFAQSTSRWIAIGPTDTDLTNGQLGATYVSVALQKTSIFQNANWWTNLISKNNTAMVTATLTGNVNGVAIADRRISPAIAIKKNNAMLDIAWAPLLIENLPVNYSGLNLDIELSKTAEDGVEKLITAANTISNNTPALKVSQTVFGYVSAAKLIGDFLFNAKLAESKLKSTSSLVTTDVSGVVAPGRYIVLAGSTPTDYAKYEAAKALLKWDGSRVTFDGQPLADISYFVVHIRYRPRIFDAAGLPNNALSSPKPWARLYKAAFAKVAAIQTPADFDGLVTEINGIAQDAQSLLGEDPDFIQAERIAIHRAVREQLKKDLEEVKKSIEAITGALLPAIDMNIQ